MKKLIAALAVLALTAGMSGAAFADGMECKDKMKEKGKTTELRQGSGPVETGAVPEKEEKYVPSPIDTHYNPFFPEMRPVDRSTGS